MEKKFENKMRKGIFSGTYKCESSSKGRWYNKYIEFEIPPWKIIHNMMKAVWNFFLSFT